MLNKESNENLNTTYCQLLREDMKIVPAQPGNDMIESCSFAVAPCFNKKNDPAKIEAYKIRILFYSDALQQNLVSQKKLLVLPNIKPNKDAVYDIYSLNGIGSTDVKKLLNEKNIRDFDVDECEKMMSMAKNNFLASEKSAQTLFVMDFKDFPLKHEDSRYDNKKDCIKVGEQKFIDFLKLDNVKASKNAKAFRQNLVNLPVDYVILEGSLKFNFLEADFLSTAEKEFFQKKGIGSQSFCQCIEFFMNAFKRGEKVTLKQNSQNTLSFDGKDYIKKLSETALDYQPVTESVTLYPSSYRELAENGLYTKAMQNSSLFAVSTKTHPDGNVEMHMIKRPQA